MPTSRGSSRGRGPGSGADTASSTARIPRGRRARVPRAQIGSGEGRAFRTRGPSGSPPGNRRLLLEDVGRGLPRQGWDSPSPRRGAIRASTSSASEASLPIVFGAESQIDSDVPETAQVGSVEQMDGGVVDPDELLVEKRS